MVLYYTSRLVVYGCFKPKIYIALSSACTVFLQKLRALKIALHFFIILRSICCCSRLRLVSSLDFNDSPGQCCHLVEQPISAKLNQCACVNTYLFWWQNLHQTRKKLSILWALVGVTIHALWLGFLYCLKYMSFSFVCVCTPMTSKYHESYREQSRCLLMLLKQYFDVKCWLVWAALL